MPRLSKSDQEAKLSATEIRRQKEETLLAIRKLELAEKEGTVIPREAVRETWAQAFTNLRAGVLRLPDRCAPEVAKVDPMEAREILRQACESLLEGLCAELSYDERK